MPLEAPKHLVLGAVHGLNLITDMHRDTSLLQSITQGVGDVRALIGLSLSIIEPQRAIKHHPVDHKRPLFLHCSG